MELPSQVTEREEWGSVKCKFIKTTFIKKFSFFKIHLHQKPSSSKTNFIHVDTCIKNHFHQKNNFHHKSN